MKNRLIILCLMLTFVELFFGSQRYQNGLSYPGSESYQGGDIKAWQNRFRIVLAEALSIDASWLNKERQPPSYLLQNPEKIYQYLLAHPQFFHSKTNESFFKDNGPPEIILKKDHVALILPVTRDEIKVYEVIITSFDGTPIPSLLFIPSKPLLGTVLFYHGHGSNYKKAAFDFYAYTHGFGYLGASMGFAVLVPEVRTFGDAIPKKVHSKAAQKYWEKQTPLIGTFVKDAMVMEDFLKNNVSVFLFSKQEPPTYRVIAGVSLGGQIALNTGALDERFDLVSTHGAFYGYEVLFTNQHCYCQWVPKLLGKANIFDVGFLVYPRTLHVGMGAKERYYNDYSKSAIKHLSGIDWKNLYIEIGPESGHELIGYGKKIYDIVTEKK